MFKQLELPVDMTETLKLLYEKTKKHDPHMNELRFLQVIIGQWLELYSPKKQLIPLQKNNVILRNDLKMAIRLCGKTQRQIADETGLNYSYLSQLINGKNEPSISVVLLLMQALNYPPNKINDLFFLESLPENTTNKNLSINE